MCYYYTGAYKPKEECVCGGGGGRGGRGGRAHGKEAKGKEGEPIQEEYVSKLVVTWHPKSDLTGVYFPGSCMNGWMSGQSVQQFLTPLKDNGLPH